MVYKVTQSFKYYLYVRMLIKNGAISSHEDLIQACDKHGIPQRTKRFSNLIRYFNEVKK